MVIVRAKQRLRVPRSFSPERRSAATLVPPIRSQASATKTRSCGSSLSRFQTQSSCDCPNISFCRTFCLADEPWMVIVRSIRRLRASRFFCREHQTRESFDSWSRVDDVQVAAQRGHGVAAAHRRSKSRAAANRRTWWQWSIRRYDRRCSRHVRRQSHRGAALPRAPLLSLFVRPSFG
jgi:hypothetical protein